MGEGDIFTEFQAAVSDKNKKMTVKTVKVTFVLNELA